MLDWTVVSLPFFVLNQWTFDESLEEMIKKHLPIDWKRWEAQIKNLKHLVNAEKLLPQENGRSFDSISGIL